MPDRSDVSCPRVPSFPVLGYFQLSRSSFKVPSGLPHVHASVADVGKSSAILLIDVLFVLHRTLHAPEDVVHAVQNTFGHGWIGPSARNLAEIPSFCVRHTVLSIHT